jgi:hypothetical protein
MRLQGFAAGPEKMVSMVFSRASSIPTTDPSHFNISIFALIPRISNSLIIAWMNFMGNRIS